MKKTLGVIFSLLIALSLMMASCVPAESAPAASEAQAPVFTADLGNVRSQIENLAKQNGVGLNQELLFFYGLLETIPQDLLPYAPRILGRVMGITGIWITVVDAKLPAEQREQILIALKAIGNLRYMKVENFIALQEMVAEIVRVAEDMGYSDVTIELPFQAGEFEFKIGSNGELFDFRLEPDPKGGCKISLSIRHVVFPEESTKVSCFDIAIVSAASTYLAGHKTDFMLFGYMSSYQANAWIELIKTAIEVWFGTKK